MSSPSGTRSRILAAAATEFASHGFAAGRVDRIAKRARVNKAMIYYHFKNKSALYREILRDMFRATGERLREIAQESAAPEQKVEAFVAALAAEATRRPHFPPIMLRELAEKGRHLDPETLRLLAVIPQTLIPMLKQAARPGSLADEQPVLGYFSLVGPMILYLSSRPVRSALSRKGIATLTVPGLEGFVQYMQDIALALSRSPLRPVRPE